MVFVNQLMTDADRGRVDFPVFTTRDGRRTTLWKWTLDAGRDAFMVLAAIEGGPHADTLQEFCFVLVYRGERIAFMAENTSLRPAGDGRAVYWRVCRVEYPQAVDAGEVRSCITDALVAFGSWWNGEQLRVSVSFD